MNSNGHILNAANKIIGQALYLSNDLYGMEAFHDLFPKNTELEFGQPITHAAMYAKSKGDVGSGVGPIDDQFVGFFEYRFISIARQIPHHDFVAFGYFLAAQLIVL